MQVAIPVHNERVSPVFDTAQHILIVDIEAGEEAARSEHDVATLSPWERAKLLSERGALHLICGAISMPMMNMLSARGITVANNIAGHVDEVLHAYARGMLYGPEFMMPGCCGRRGSRSRHGHGWRDMRR
jgi:predicted Fe-Mo cluster-binding NifX family protein